jgi:hypothetical protein
LAHAVFFKKYRGTRKTCIEKITISYFPGKKKILRVGSSGAP